MPAILVRILGWMMASMATRMLFSLGLGFFTFSSFTSIFNYIESEVATSMNNSPPNIIIFFNLFHIDIYVSLLLSAFAIKATIYSAKIIVGKS